MLLYDVNMLLYASISNFHEQIRVNWMIDVVDVWKWVFEKLWKNHCFYHEMVFDDVKACTSKLIHVR
jgi:hypothetical protein